MIKRPLMQLKIIDDSDTMPAVLINGRMDPQFYRGSFDRCLRCGHKKVTTIGYYAPPRVPDVGVRYGLCRLCAYAARSKGVEGRRACAVIDEKIVVEAIAFKMLRIACEGHA